MKYKFVKYQNNTEAFKWHARMIYLSKPNFARIAVSVSNLFRVILAVRRAHTKLLQQNLISYTMEDDVNRTYCQVSEFVTVHGFRNLFK